MFNLSTLVKTPMNSKMKEEWQLQMKSKKFVFPPSLVYDSGDEDIPDEFSPANTRQTNHLTVTRSVKTQQLKSNLANSFQYRNSHLLKSKITITR